MVAAGQRQRAYEIDAVKGIAILCITFLHFEEGIIPMWLNTWIALFMTTTFFFTSGWIAGLQEKRKTPKELFKKRIKQLGAPYLWFSIIIIVFDIIWTLLGYMDIQILARDIYKAITLRGIGALWFLPVLFGAEMIFCYIRNCKHKLPVIAAAILLLYVVYILYYVIWLPIRGESTLNKLIDAPIKPIVQSFTLWPIIAAGYLVSKYVFKNVENLNKIILFLCGVTIISFSILQILSPLFVIPYINTFLSNILPTIGFIIISKVVGYNNYFSRFFIFWGTNSLVLMCTHYSIMMEIFIAIDNKYIHSDFCGYSTIIYFILTILLTYPLVHLFNNKLKYMIGKE